MDWPDGLSIINLPLISLRQNLFFFHKQYTIESLLLRLANQAILGVDTAKLMGIDFQSALKWNHKDW